MAKLIDIIRQTLAEDGSADLPKGRSERELIRTLNMLTHDGNAAVRQRACYKLADIIARMSREKIEDHLRRLLWRMNPESGDHPVGAPELIGEIGRRTPQLIADFLPAIMLYLEDEKLLPGLLQAAGRIGEKNPEALSPYTTAFLGHLEHANPMVAGNAGLALCRIGGASAERAKQFLLNDGRNVDLLCGEKETCRVSLGELTGRCSEFADDFCFIVGPEED